MPDTPPNGSPGPDADGAMGSAPAVEVADRERIRAEARAKLFGEAPPGASESTISAETGQREPSSAPDPERIGRFRILGRLGAGGMGVVYSAYDPELDRKVALKLLRPDLAEDSSRGSTGTTRLQREAQAMARLNHPNVVTVHEVGRHGDQVFVAMEFIEGNTLREWAKHDHDWSEVIRVYCDAATGLGTAHAAGIVHRDFKPDNVMLGIDGRVRVMDFGLSRAETTPTLEEVTSLEGGQSGALTQTGALMGTPAYMAPEQHDAAPATAASDQFAFCVSLWEALAGERPFAGESYGELAGNVVMGRLRSPPSSSRAPGRVFDVLRRGLATDAADRWQSMEQLRDALHTSPARMLRRVGAGAVAVAAIAAGVHVATRSDPLVAGACDDAGAPIRESWGESNRDAVESALLQTKAPYAAATWSTVDEMLGKYADEWSRAAEAHCSARLVESASPTTLGRQAQCLESRRGSFDELVAVLSSSEEGIAQQAVQTVATLAPVEACADPRRLEAFSTTRAPEAQDALGAARTQLARARARGGMGRYDESLTLAAEVIEAGRKYDDPSTEAAGLLVRGQYQERKGDLAAAETSLREAVRLAEIAHDHTTRALGLIRLIYVVGRDAERHDEARALGADAGAVLRMLGADPLLQAGLDMNLGGADRVARELDDALEHYQAALDTYLELFGEAHPETGRALTSLGGLHISRREPEKAVETLLRAKASFAATLGAEHPFIPVVLSNLGTAYMLQDDLPKSINTLQEALVLRKRADGDEHPGVAKTLFNLGAAQYRAQRYEESIGSLAEGLRILQRADTTDPLRLARYELIIGSAQVNLGRFGEARETLQPLLDVFPISRGPEGAFARRARLYLSVATIEVDLRRARVLAEIAKDGAGETDEEYDGLEFLLALYDTLDPLG